MDQETGEGLEAAIARAKAEAESPKTEWWNPEEHGTFVGGKVLEVFTVDGQHGEFPAVLLLTESGAELAVAGSRTALKEKLKEKNPQPGDVMTIEYHGLRKSEASGFEYHAYAVGHIAEADL